MDQIEFYNATGRPIYLPGPNGEKVMFSKFERKLLPQWYRRYVPRYLKESRLMPPPPNPNQVQRSNMPRGVVVQPIIRHGVPGPRHTTVTPMIQHQKHYGRPKIVGAVDMHSEQATNYLHQVVKQSNISISDDIGVGILSFNRIDCLSRLINSIKKHTDLTKTTVFISDESTDDKMKDYLKDITGIVIMSGPRLGVAGNSNRLLRCLSRFRYKILLNDDVEVTQRGWEKFYFTAMEASGYHHFLYRQPGVYGAGQSDGAMRDARSIRVRTIHEKPHGAVMALDHKAFTTVGYFDEGFGPYGMEHVDWSNRVSLSGIQDPGFHDVPGSETFFKIHNEHSVTPDRTSMLANAQKLYSSFKTDRNRIRIEASDSTNVPAITYIIPFRGTDRKESIRTVLQNIKAQHFPHIEIIMVEQDFSTTVTLPEFESVKYALAQSLSPDQPFTKSLAFNFGASLMSFKKMILHDADMIVYDGYTSRMDQLLQEYDGVHIGKSVLYLSYNSTGLVNSRGVLSEAAHAERSVKYYEGGSLGCLYNTYIRIGGFNEEFIGYGCEDCDFFARLASTKFFNERSVDLVHLWHNRTDGNWKAHHEKNKQIEAALMKTAMPDRVNKLYSALIAKYKLSCR